MSHTILSLDSLTPREAVADALYRCILGIDSNNAELYKSGIYQDAASFFEVVGMTKIETADAINKYIFDHIFPLTTLHQITNVRVDVKDGANTAFMTAHAVAHHYRPDDAFKPERLSFVTAGLYTIEAVKDEADGLWKIKGWSLKLNWTEGDRSILAG